MRSPSTLFCIFVQASISMIKFRQTVLILFTLTLFKSYAQNGLQRLNAEIENLKNDSDLLHASWGICVIETQTGKLLSEYNSNTSLIPASTQKLITTAAGLNLLGSDFVYETSLEYDGLFDSVSGTIKGNLYITGSGDPTLESKYFKNKNDSTPLVKKWANVLLSKGVKNIEGSIIADESVFDDEMIPSNWIWGDMGNYYGAGASGLSYMDNMYTLYFNSGSAKDSTNIIKIVPSIPNLKLTNYVRAAGNDDDAYIYGAPYNDYRYVTGTIPPNKTNFDVKGSIPDPPYFLAIDFNHALSENGIRVNGSPTSVRRLMLNNNYQKSTRKKIYIHTSPPLSKIVYWTNLISNNLFAEHILKTIALQKHNFGSEYAGIGDILKFWSSKGIDIKGMNLSDGCGLSRANTVTAKQLAQICNVMTTTPVYNVFYNSLPVAGKTGTMTNVCRGSYAENNMRAKSGSISRVRSYAGYVTNKKGNQLSFAVIVNNFDCSTNTMKKKLEKLMILISETD